MGLLVLLLAEAVGVEGGQSYFIQDPQSEGRRLEFRELCQGEASGESLRKAAKLILDHGRQNLEEDGKLRCLRMAFLDELKLHEAFRAALSAHAAELLQSHFATAGDLESWSLELGAFEGLVETRAYRLRLLDEFLDRGDWLRAKDQALMILGKSEDAFARAKLMRLQVLLGEVTTDPNTTASIRFKGESMTLQESQRRLSPGVIRPEAGDPGKYIASLLLPPLASAFSFQPLEPRAHGRHLALTAPGFLTLLEAENGKPILDLRDSPGAFLDASHDTTPSYGAALLPQGAIRFLPRAKGLVGLCATGWDGRPLWSTQDHASSDRWTVCGTPRVAGGSCYVTVMEAKEAEEAILGLASFNPGTGVLQEVTSLQSSLLGREQLRMAGALDDDGERLFGILDTGLAFAWDLHTRHLLFALDLAPLPSAGAPVQPAPVPSLVQAGLNFAAFYVPRNGDLHVLESGTGRTLWSRHIPGIRHIHSRGDSHVFIFSAEPTEAKDSYLGALDLASGKELWHQPLQNARVTGEGATTGARAVIPTTRGLELLDAATGKITRTQAFPTIVDKVRAAAGRWLVFSGRYLHVLANEGVLDPGAIAPPASAEAAPPAPAPAPASDDGSDLMPERSVVCPCDIPKGDDEAMGFWRSARLYLSVRPRHHILQNGDFLCLLREGSSAADGSRVFPDLLWAMRRPNACVVGDRILVYDANRLEVMDALSLRPLYGYDPRGEGRAILNAVMNAQTTVVMLTGETANGPLEAQVLEAASGRPRSRFKLAHRFREHQPSLHESLYLDRFNEGGEKVACYDLAQDGKLLWNVFFPNKDLILFQFHRVTVPLANGAGERWLFLNYATGKLLTSKELGTPGDFRGLVPIPNAGELVVYASHTDFSDGARVVRLQRNHLQPSGVRRGDRLVVVDGNNLFNYALKDGKLLDKRPFFDGKANYSCLLEDSVLLIRDGRIYFLRRPAQSEKDNRQICVTLGPGREDEETSTTLYHAETLDGGDWIGPASAMPASKGELRLGANAENVMFALRVPAPRKPEARRVLRLTCAWIPHRHSDSWRSYAIEWRFDELGRCESNLPEDARLRATCRRRPDGGAELNLRFARAPLGVEASQPMNPWSQCEVGYEDGGRTQGYYRQGVALGPLHGLHYGVQRFVELPSLEDYAAHRELYSGATGLFPQGRELAAWLHARLVVEDPGGDNRAFLKDMLARTRASYSSINVLAARLAEEARLLKSTLPRENYAAEFPRKLQELARQLDREAETLGLPAAWRARALTSLLVQAEPQEKSAAPVFHWGPLLRYSALRGILVSGDGTYATAYEDLCNAPDDRLHFLAAHLGLFEGAAAPRLESLMLEQLWGRDTSDRLSFRTARVLKVDPSGVVELRDEQGKPAAGVRSDDPNILSFPALNFTPHPPLYGLKAEEMQFGLRHLPPTARYGTHLADSYLSSLQGARGAALRPTLSLLINRSAGSLEALAGSAAYGIQKLKEESPGQPPALAYGEIASMMEAAGVSKGLQRRIFLGLTNAFNRPEDWYNLGAVPVKDGLLPLPETVRFTPSTSFKSGESTLHFETPRPEHGGVPGTTFFLRNNLESDQMAYHATVVQARAPRRASAQIGRLRPGPRHFCSLWLNGQQLLSGAEVRFPEILSLPLQLQGGENLLLVAVHFEREWSLSLSVGSVAGLPLEGVRLSAPTPDQSPPSAPAGLVAAAEGESQAQLRWTPARDAESAVPYYVILRDGKSVGTCEGTAFSDTGLHELTDYRYRVVAVNGWKLETPGEEVTLRTPADHTPPALLAATAPHPARRKIKLVFSEALDPATATDTHSYRLAPALAPGGPQVAILKVRPGRNPGIFYLETAGLDPGKNYKLEVTGVRDASAARNPGAIATLDVAVPVEGNGLLGEYFSGIGLAELRHSRVDPKIEFDWSLREGPYPDMLDNFSVRWRGYLVPDKDSNATLFTATDDGARLWLDGKKIIDDWTPHPLKENKAQVQLKAGVIYPITMEYFETNGDCSAHLQWLRSAMDRKIPIPTRYLYPCDPDDPEETAALRGP